MMPNDCAHWRLKAGMRVAHASRMIDKDVPGGAPGYAATSIYSMSEDGSGIGSPFSLSPSI